MMIKLSDREAELLATLLEGCDDSSDSIWEDARRLAKQIRSRLAAPPVRLDMPVAEVRLGYAPPAGTVLPPHHRASHWRKPISGIDP